MINPQDSRQLIRKRMRKKRRALSDQQRLQYSLQFASQFSKTRHFINAKHIAFYLASDGELDLLPLMSIATNMGKACYLPVLTAPYQNRLFFAKYKIGDQLHYNKYGIAEPGVAASVRVNPTNLDLVLTPLVAFDGRGNRLGMGGGYYDRTFSFLNNRKYYFRPKLLGVAYPFQQVDNLQSQYWDVKLQGVYVAR